MKGYINKIIEGDCLQIMQKLPSNSFDMSFADPPFNLGKKYGQYDDTEKSKEEYLDWCSAWLREIAPCHQTYWQYFYT